MVEVRFAEVAEGDEEHRRLEEEHAAQIREFLEGDVTETELAPIRSRAATAIENGQFEIEILRSPSDPTTDRGCALDNYEDGWPETLRGNAATYYKLYQERAKPLRYNLHASILNYPDGKPGDVGLYLSWA